MNLTDALLAEALSLVERGLLVFPCRPSTTDDGRWKAKIPLCAGGFTSATSDPAQVRRWWRRDPFAMIGVPTGIPGGWDVLDVDRHPDGVDGMLALDRLRAAGLVEGAIRLATTAGGGLHLCYPATGHTKTGPLRGMGLDIKGVGGYVIVAPSVLLVKAPVGWEVGGRYETLSESHSGSPLRADEIRALLTPPTPVKPWAARMHTGGNLASLQAWLARQEQGNRNHALYWAACTAIEKGFDPDELTDVALSIGLDQYEIRASIASAKRKAVPGDPDVEILEVLS